LIAERPAGLQRWLSERWPLWREASGEDAAATRQKKKSEVSLVLVRLGLLRLA
jgi:hypothetical protein